MQDAPRLAGVHHLKLPVTDLARSLEWYQTRLGYRVQIEFVEQGQLMGYGLEQTKRGADAGPAAQPRKSHGGRGL
jgi:catechol 2,3-dioxygenase-like lactoylglutathione lyase family enzyme